MKTLKYLIIAAAGGFLITSSFAQEAVTDRWAGDIKAFQEQAEAEGFEKGSVVCVGSSSMRMWHSRIKEDLAPLTVIPRGFGGSAFRDVNRHFDALVAQYAPRAVLIYEGDNDLAIGLSITEVLRDFLTFVDKVESLDPGIRIYVIGVKPSGSRWALWPVIQEYNERLAAIAAMFPQVTYIDVSKGLLDDDGFVRPEFFIEDNLHLSDAGYDRWAESVRRVIVPAERRFEKKK